MEDSEEIEVIVHQAWSFSDSIYLSKEDYKKFIEDPVFRDLVVSERMRLDWSSSELQSVEVSDTEGSELLNYKC